VVPIVEVRGGVAEITSGDVFVIDWDDINGDLSVSEDVLDEVAFYLAEHLITEDFANFIRGQIYELWPALQSEIDEP
jgi:hypothetical protein